MANPVTITVMNNNKILSAKSDKGTLEIILATGQMLYNNKILRLQNFINDTDEDINFDLVHLAMALRKTIFESINLRSTYDVILTVLRRITASHPFPASITINRA